MWDPLFIRACSSVTHTGTHRDRRCRSSSSSRRPRRGGAPTRGKGWPTARRRWRSGAGAPACLGALAGGLDTAWGGSWPPSHGDRRLDGRHSMPTAARGWQPLAVSGKEERRTMAKVLRSTREMEGTHRGRATCAGGATRGGSVDGACRRPTGPGKGRVGGGAKRGRWCYNGGMRGSSEMEGRRWRLGAPWAAMAGVRSRDEQSEAKASSRTREGTQTSALEGVEARGTRLGRWSAWQLCSAMVGAQTRA
jgi:hypothetical protein